MKSSRGIFDNWRLSLNEAIESKNYIYLQEYVAAGLNFNSRETIGLTPLQIALRMNDIKMVRFLLEHKADPNQNCLLYDQWNYHSPLHFALVARSSAMVILLIKYGANIFEVSNEKMPLICLAVKNNRIHVIRYLIENGTSPDTLINNESSLLTYAAEKGKIGVVKFILKYKPDLNLHQHKQVITAAIHGMHNGWKRLISSRIVSVLYKYGFTLDQADINPRLVENAIVENQCHVISNLLKLGMSPNYEIHTQAERDSILHLAVKTERPEIVQLLLEAGAEVHIRDHCEKTPILYAAYVNNIRLIRLLLKHGASVTDVDSHNCTVLHSAIMKNCSRCVSSYDWRSNKIKSGIVELFISKGADINAKCSDGCSPLDYAAFAAIPSVVQVLLVHGARVDEVNSFNKTVMEMALVIDHGDINNNLGAHISEIFIERRAATIQLLQQHIQRLHRVELPICSRDIRYNDEVFRLSDNVNKIIDSEIKFMKETKIGNSFVTFYRFLKSTDEEVARFVENELLLKGLKLMLHFSNKFYGYADLIRHKLQVALTINKLERETFESIKSFFEEKKLPSLPDECIRHIMNFLTDEDKKVIIDQFAK